jgi:Fur family ferric uptake transcriptional regulator
MDDALRDRWLQRADRLLTGAGLRAGAARTAVVEVLARKGQCLLSAQGTASPASVYRVLDELFELGLLHRLDGRDGTARFEIADPERHHHHLVDESTGTVRAFADETLEEAIAAVGRRLGMRLTSHEVVLRGVPDPGVQHDPRV